MKPLIILLILVPSLALADGPFPMQPANFHSVGGFLSLSSTGMNLYMGAGTSAITNAYTINGLALTGTGITISGGTSVNYGAISPLILSGTNYALSGTASLVTTGTGAFGNLNISGSSSLDTGSITTNGSGALSLSIIGSGQLVATNSASVLVGTSIGSGLTLSGTVLSTAATYLSSVSANAPITGSGTPGSPLVLAPATSAANGYLASADFITFSGKQTAGNYITALSGNVVANGPGAVSATIQSGVVTLVMMANESPNTILGNSSTLSATPQALTPNTVATMIGLGTAAYTSSSIYSPLAGSTSLTTLGTIVTGTIPLGNLATIGSGTVLGNSGTGSATPSALSIATLSGTSMLNLGQYQPTGAYVVYNVAGTGTIATSGSGSLGNLAVGGTANVVGSIAAQGGSIYTQIDSRQITGVAATTAPALVISGTGNYSLHLKELGGTDVLLGSELTPIIYGLDQNTSTTTAISMLGGIVFQDSNDGNNGAVVFQSPSASFFSGIDQGAAFGPSGSTGDLFYYSNNATHYFSDTNGNPGRILNGTYPSDDGSTSIQFIAPGPTSIVARFTAAAGQTANLQQWETSNGTSGVVLAVGPNGVSASSLVCTNSASQLAAVTVGSGLSFTSGTLSSTSSGSLSYSGTSSVTCTGTLPSGSIICSETVIGGSSGPKTVLINCNGSTGTTTKYVFPTPYAVQPSGLIGVGVSGASLSLSTTAATVTTATSSGFVQIIGY